MENANKNIELVLGPLSQTEFNNEYWEKSPLHISRNSESHFAELLTIMDIESMLSTQALLFPSVQLTQSGHQIDIGDYTDDNRRILPHRLIDRHRNGATIVVSQAHEKIPSLATFRRAMQKAFNLNCQTNVYLSPTGKQGFNAHYDSHDVFILQVSGTKTFNFYDGGIDLPYSHDGFQADKHPIGELSMSIDMQAGDSLYIPRGVLHDAIATDQTSLHITLGVYAITVRDVLLEMTQKLTAESPIYRQSVPTSLNTNGDSFNMQTLIETCLSPVFSKENVLNALSAIYDSQAIDSLPCCEGMLRTQPAIDRVQDTDTLEHKSIVIDPSLKVQLDQRNLISFEQLADNLRLRSHGQILEFTLLYQPAIELLLSGKQLAISDLPELSDLEKHGLIQKLDSASLLSIAPT